MSAWKVWLVLVTDDYTRKVEAVCANQPAVTRKVSELHEREDHAPDPANEHR
jgi:hypothetical protein